ncbi:MAG TPA: class I SAM-dependent methyltransferase [Terriglobales bacterium]|nr:class I SAM-dependent methyltransferase [Terriglobales bacterium]
MGKKTRSREWDSAAYNRISGPQFSWGKKVVDRVSARGDELVLDAGCGTGKLTAEVLAKLPRGRVVAVDLSENMLRAASEQLTAKFGERIVFVAADLQDLPFNQCFDGIFSTAAFHWVPDHDRLFRNLYQSLKPGGWLLAQCGGGPNLSRLLGRVSVLSQQPSFAPYLADHQPSWMYSDAETTAKRLRSAGFVEVETSLEAAPTPLDNAQRYCEFVSKVILHRHLERIPDAKLQRQFVEELSRQAAKDDPPFLLDYWRLNLSGRRPS